MKTKKTRFFIRLKNAVINFDEYKNFSEEKTLVAIKYVLKLVLIFTFILTIALTYKVVQEANNIITDFKNESPEFSFQDGLLTIEGDNTKTVKGDDSGYFGFIIDSKKESLRDVDESGDYQRVIGFLKDKIVVRDVEGVEASLTYSELSQNYDLNNINKDTVLQFLSRK